MEKLKGQGRQTNRNNRSNTRILFFLCLLFTSNSWGQYQRIEFDHYTINDGLSNGYITAILQDSEGFMWIGTSNGLNRFDGLSFKTYFYNPKDTNSISGNAISNLTEDASGRIWVMTNTDFCVYDKKTDRFARKKLKINGTRIDNLIFTTSFIDRKGFLWMGTYGQIYRLKIYNNPQINSNLLDAQAYDLEERDLQNINRTQVHAFVEDENGIVWTTSFSNKLFHFDRSLNKFIPYAINYPEINKFSNKHKGFMRDREGNFYITIEYEGLLVWERNINKFTLYKPGGNNPILFALCEDNNGLIWTGERNTGGVNIFNKKTKKFMNLLSDELDPSSLISNKISLIYCDKSGFIWIGANVGINKYCPGKIKFTRYFSNSKKADQLSCNNTLCFAEGKNNELWVGTDGGGLNKLDRITGKFTHYLNDPSNPNTISSNAIISLCMDHEGLLWIGTFNGGLARMKDNKFSVFLPNSDNPNSIAQNHVWYVLEDSKNNLWVATLSSGLDLFDRKTNRFYHYINIPGDSTSICNNSLISIFEDSKQKLYITSYLGVSTIDLNTTDFSKSPPKIKFHTLLHDDNKNSISSNGIYCIAEDREKNIWFGTMATGMDKFERSTGKFTNYSIKDGLPGNTVSSILFDDDQNLWIATDKGLAKFNPVTKEIHVFSCQDGLQNNNLKGWAIKTKNGEMFFGGADGFNSFNPKTITYNKHIPPVFITGLKIFNQPVKVDEKVNGRVILREDISETHQLILHHDENFLTFNFIALEYTSPWKNEYAYTMEGNDKGWVNCGISHEANYTNLNPGKYLFRIRASNSDGIWNQKGTSLEIIILPPWWKRMWFKLLVFSIFLISVYFIYNLRIELYRKKQVELVKLVKQRTREITQANEMLLERQASIEEYAEELRVHSENMREANELLIENKKIIQSQTDQLKDTNQQLMILNSTKDRFFSIIAHDLRNPFHVVSGFAEVLLNDLDNLPPEKTRRFIQLIHTSSQSGSKLLENLLQWSRSQTGRISFEPVNLNLSSMVEETINLLEGDAQGKNITFKSLISDDFTVLADENMVKTILRNLVSNAIKFTPNNGSVTIKSSKAESLVEVTVADTGVGIPPENLALLFRVDATLTTRGTSNESGTGLGLILCKEFIEKHNGKIWVESEVGKGSEFKFTLPIS